MEATLLQNKFARIGARLKVTVRPSHRLDTLTGFVSLDVRPDGRKEFFEIVRRAASQPTSAVFLPPWARTEISVLDLQPAERHLLLLVREDGEKQKFLCGHDERHWFVAAVPESAPVGTVRQAKEALKPVEVQDAQARHRIKAPARKRRKNAAYIRQGEWFFIPAPDFVVDETLVLRNEPLSRGRGKPHWAECCYRTGGETVYVCSRYTNGLNEKQFQSFLSGNPKAKSWGWRAMRRNLRVYARGRIRHADHQTIMLRGWHRVLMNTENQAKAMRNVAFLD